MTDAAPGHRDRGRVIPRKARDAKGAVIDVGNLELYIRFAAQVPLCGTGWVVTVRLPRKVKSPFMRCVFLVTIVALAQSTT
jgi:hypothetical protein